MHRRFLLNSKCFLSKNTEKEREVGRIKMISEIVFLSHKHTGAQNVKTHSD